MIRVILSGAAGRMGRILARKIEESDAYALAGCVDPYGGEAMAASLEDCTADADVVIDFSSHDGTEALLTAAVSRNLPPDIRKKSVQRSLRLQKRSRYSFLPTCRSVWRS